MKIVRLTGIAATTTVVVATALPSNYLSLKINKNKNYLIENNNISLKKTLIKKAVSLKSFITRPVFFNSALYMDTLSNNNFTLPSQNGSSMPELLTEYMVDMKCEGCVTSVKNKLQTVDGVKNIEVDLSNQVVRILGVSPVKTMTEALEQTGKKARLIGQGVPEDFLVSAAVAEFKGPEVFGVARLAQVNMELARIEANFSGLPPGKHGWSINQYGDLTSGPASTGGVFNPTSEATGDKPLGDLGTLEVNEKGEAFFSSVKEKLRVVDLIGRSIVVYGSEDKSDQGLAAAVVARSAGVGENYKKLCTCDGTTIWEATDSQQDLMIKL